VFLAGRVVGDRRLREPGSRVGQGNGGEVPDGGLWRDECEFGF